MTTINDREDGEGSADSNRIPERSARPPYKAAKTAEPIARKALPPAPRESQGEQKLTYKTLFEHDQQDVLSSYQNKNSLGFTQAADPYSDAQSIAADGHEQHASTY